MTGTTIVLIRIDTQDRDLLLLHAVILPKLTFFRVFHSVSLLNKEFDRAFRIH